MRKLKPFELIAIRKDETIRQRNGARPVSLVPIFKGEKRRHVVDKAIDVLKDWRLSPFENEGAVRAGLRSALCLQGYPWRRSDFEAAALVETGLSRIGAVRPTWEQGQPDYTSSFDYCSWCRGPLDRETTTRKQRFCSGECATMALANRERKSSSYAGVTLRSAQRLITKESAPPKPCEYCGVMFKSDREDARFCSVRCVARWQKGDLLLMDIMCEGCGKFCKPANRHSRFCSHTCASSVVMAEKRAHLAGETRSCKHCGKAYTPTVDFAVYCSPDCASTVAKRAWYERNYKPAEHHLRCDWCGSGYVSKMPWSTSCSEHCRRQIQSFNKPSRRPRPITGEGFDYMFNVRTFRPNRVVTAPIFDKLFKVAA